MFTSLEDFENSWAFAAVFVVAFPVLFLAITSFVLLLTSYMSGWRQLARLYRYEGQSVECWQHRGGGGIYSTRLPFGGMRGRLAVGATPTGMVIKPPFILFAFHPSLFLPFDKISDEEPRRFLGIEFIAITMEGAPKVRVAILQTARQMAQGVQNAAP